MDRIKRVFVSKPENDKKRGESKLKKLMDKFPKELNLKYK
jgi:hypothetical protein